MHRRQFTVLTASGCYRLKVERTTGVDWGCCRSDMAGSLSILRGQLLSCEGSAAEGSLTRFTALVRKSSACLIWPIGFGLAAC